MQQAAVPQEKLRDLGARLRELRRSLGLNQVELARKLDVSSSHVSKIEAGSGSIGRSLLYKICKELNVAEEWLVDGEGKGPTGKQVYSAEIREAGVAWDSRRIGEGDKQDGEIDKIIGETYAVLTDDVALKAAKSWAAATETTELAAVCQMVRTRLGY